MTIKPIVIAIGSRQIWSNPNVQITEAQRSVLALCAIRVQGRSVDWSLIAREAQLEGGLDALWKGEFHERSGAADAARATLRNGIRYRKNLLDWVDREIDAAENVGASLITVLDDTYPELLRLSPNLPPFLFVCGDITSEDSRSVAMIGTKEGSRSEIQTARKITKTLADKHVTIVSGLEGKTDRSVHQAAIAGGGRTLAVLGAGITTRNDPSVSSLAIQVEQNGALISPFWSTRPLIRNSPRRQIIASELSQGTVLIEAANKSRARTLARIAREQGKKVFVHRSLITKHNWTQNIVDKRGALEVKHIDDITTQLASPERIRLLSAQRREMTLGLL